MIEVIPLRLVARLLSRCSSGHRGHAVPPLVRVVGVAARGGSRRGRGRRRVRGSSGVRGSRRVRGRGNAKREEGFSSDIKGYKVV